MAAGVLRFTGHLIPMSQDSTAKRSLKWSPVDASEKWKIACNLAQQIEKLGQRTD